MVTNRGDQIFQSGTNISSSIWNIQSPQTKYFSFPEMLVRGDRIFRGTKYHMTGHPWSTVLAVIEDLGMRVRISGVKLSELSTLTYCTWDTHFTQMKLTIACIAQFFSHIIHGAYTATRFPENINSPVHCTLQKKRMLQRPRDHFFCCIIALLWAPIADM